MIFGGDVLQGVTDLMNNATLNDHLGKDSGDCFSKPREVINTSNQGNLKTLTVREAGILELLCRNKGSVVKKESILSEFWNVDSDFYAGRSLEVFMNNLRKSLAEKPAIEIKTVRGVGYILSVRT